MDPDLAAHDAVMHDDLWLSFPLRISCLDMTFQFALSIVFLTFFLISMVKLRFQDLENFFKEANKSHRRGGFSKLKHQCLKRLFRFKFPPYDLAILTLGCLAKESPLQLFYYRRSLVDLLQRKLGYPFLNQDHLVDRLVEAYTAPMRYEPCFLAFLYLYDYEREPLRCLEGALRYSAPFDKHQKAWLLAVLSRLSVEKKVDRGFIERIRQLIYVTSGFEEDDQESHHYFKQHQGRSDEEGRYEGSPKRSLQSICKVLGVDATAGEAEIRTAHRRLMRKYHPDKLASQGISKEQFETFSKKAQEIQSAFNDWKKYYA